MNRSCKTVSAQLIIVLGLLMPLGLLAQTESKTYKERYNVADDAVLEINTSYADIEFETWGRDEVAITATITLEGATKEEAEAYFNGNPIEILGNSSTISIASKSKNNRFFAMEGTEFDHNDLHIEIPEIATFVMSMPQVAPFPSMPPLPQTEAFSFDYEAFQKDGDKYMKQWQKNFEKSFDKEHQKRLEEWAEKMEKRAEEMEQRLEEQNEQRQKRLEERAEEMEQRLKEREEVRAKQMVKRDSIRTSFFVRRDSLRSAPNIFYLNTDQGTKNYKIKKTIKISLPKSTRIKMDVRHGEVKLAANTKNLNAKLSHSSLWANSIDGKETNVCASYSPVTVAQWNHGQLSTSYSEQISLNQVVQLQLETVSSEVTIEKLLKSALVKNNFGAVHILELGPDFKDLDISLKNAEFRLALPKVASDIYVKGNSSTFDKPKGLNLKETVNGSTRISKGYHLNDNSGRSIMITSDYSEVVVQ
ncbi:hypothetical protein SAMN04488009_3320 [Maribacter sedimenticola]|uniref:Adhesin domain-containing protein n=1 Tax=Maribacter sedimenticola TaxID=228956 RepID=A0ABY1SKL0_9FLAO|nr:hypothetical protein [Maribacter sedimenticola]SNR70827.1 hypothetical protein SAMN04488009_3320 [Maribacter sedimenticola]